MRSDLHNHELSAQARITDLGSQLTTSVRQHRAEIKLELIIEFRRETLCCDALDSTYNTAVSLRSQDSPSSDSRSYLSEALGSPSLSICNLSLTQGWERWRRRHPRLKGGVINSKVHWKCPFSKYLPEFSIQNLYWKIFSYKFNMYIRKISTEKIQIYIQTSKVSFGT